MNLYVVYFIHDNVTYYKNWGSGASFSNREKDAKALNTISKCMTLIGELKGFYSGSSIWIDEDCANRSPLGAYCRDIDFYYKITEKPYLYYYRRKLTCSYVLKKPRQSMCRVCGLDLRFMKYAPDIQVCALCLEEYYTKSVKQYIESLDPETIINIRASRVLSNLDGG